MDGWVIRICLCALCVMALAGCARVKPAEGPLELAAFSYRHSGMDTGSIYELDLEKCEGGTRVMLSLIAGEHTADVVLEEDLLAQLGALAAQYRMDRWDGFDKTDKRVLDGESFKMQMTLTDGRVIRAKGSNAYPKGYEEVMPHIDRLINELTIRCTELYPKKIASEHISYVSFEVRGKPYTTSEIKLTAQRNADGTAEVNGRIRSREDLAQQDTEVIASAQTFPFEEVQSILQAHDAAQWNGWDQNALQGEYFGLYVRYDSGETLEVRGTALPEGFALLKEELALLMTDHILAADE